MKRSFLFLALLFMTLTSTFGQVDESYKSTLKKMLEVSGSEESFKVSIKQMFDLFKNQATTVPDSIMASIEGEFLKTSLDDLVDMLAPVYQKSLAESDLKGIIEFYQTPIGKKYAEKTPTITQESMLVGQQWGMKISQKFQEKLKGKGY